MGYFGMSAGTSPNIIETAGAAITNGACKALGYNSNGNVTVCTSAGAAAIGIADMTTPASLASGELVSVQIKDVCRWTAGAAIAKGALLATDANGCAVTATDSAFILGVALTAASGSDQVIEAQLTKSGYVPAAG